MTMRQILSVVFSAFWDRADLYTDVLALDAGPGSVTGSCPYTDREFKLAFLRQGRIVLATPIESPDDMTMISAGVRGIMGNGDGAASVAGSTVSVVQAGTPVSRKAKLKFQAISLAYELLKDETKRAAYDEWRLWNSRLPPPPPKVQTKGPRLESSSSASSQNASDGTGSSQEGSLKYRMAAGDDPNVVSILKKSSMNHRRRRLRRPRAAIKSDRKISWNEEVEELVITETLPPYDPLIDSVPKENDYGQYQGLDDPYGDTPEDWFGTVDNQSDDEWGYSSSSRDNDRDQRRRNKNRQVNTTKEDDVSSSRLKDHTNVNNFNSLNSQTMMVAEQGSSSGIVFEGYNPNDSLMVILDDPLSPERKKETVGVGVGEEAWDGFPDDHWNKQSNDSHLHSHSHSQPRSQLSIDVEPSISHGTSETAVPILPQHPDTETDDGCSLASHSMQSTVTWNSVPTIERGDDCDIGRTVDLAKGFQATLSNYINSAVEDMKEGLKLMGKQWDDIASSSTGAGGGENKNFFFLQTNELDAMMDILQTEMRTLTSPTCAQTRKPPSGSNGNGKSNSINRLPTQEQAFKQASAERKPVQQKRFFGNLFSKS